MTAYTPEQVQAALAEPALSGWQLDPASGEIFREYQFADFLASIAFVNRLAPAAEEAGHHPDILIRYNRVRLNLITHDAGYSLTENDFKMAARANELV